jgi:hypothetical protein
MKYLSFIVLLISSCQVAAGVYKCTIGDKTVYQQVPCREGDQEITIHTAPSNSPSPASSIPGLRDAERELLEHLQAESAEPEPPPPQLPAVTSATQSCRGIQVLGFKTYTGRIVDDYGYMSVNHCALVKLRLDMYSGRLRESVAKEIGPRFYARFIDDETYPVYSIELEGPDRVSPVNRQFSARICFGDSRYEIEQVGCY